MIVCAVLSGRYLETLNQASGVRHRVFPNNQGAPHLHLLQPHPLGFDLFYGCVCVCRCISCSTYVCVRSKDKPLIVSLAPLWDLGADSGCQASIQKVTIPLCPVCRYTLFHERLRGSCYLPLKGNIPWMLTLRTSPEPSQSERRYNHHPLLTWYSVALRWGTEWVTPTAWFLS